jgi:hypothetical protein
MSGERLTLLVNIWLGHRPLDVGRFPSQEILTPDTCFEAGGTLLSLKVAAEADLLDCGVDSEAVELGVECGSWRLIGARLPPRMGIARGLSRINLGRGNLQAEDLPLK